jgi:hypothetical protein
MITAEHVTAAIRRACQATGEKPEDVRGRVSTLRARHYALHALLHCFKITGGDAATLCGAPSEPKHFYGNSYQQVFRPREDGTGRRMAQWFNEAIFGDVVAAVQAVVVGDDAVPVAQEKDQRGGRRSHGRPRKPRAPIVEQPKQPAVHVRNMASLRPATREAITEVAKAASKALSIDLTKIERQKPKPPRIDFIDTVPRHLIGKIEAKPSTYQRDAYNPKGHITPKRYKSKADMYAELQAAVLNTPGAKRCRD